MKLRLDIAACQGSGNCNALAPELFDFDEDSNKAVLLDPEPSGDLEDAAQAAEAACPALAISIDRSPEPAQQKSKSG